MTAESKRSSSRYLAERFIGLVPLYAGVSGLVPSRYSPLRLERLERVSIEEERAQSSRGHSAMEMPFVNGTRRGEGGGRGRMVLPEDRVGDFASPLCIGWCDDGAIARLR